MGISPWPQGQTTPAIIFVCTKDNGQPLNLTGLTASNLSLLIHPASGSDIVGTGTFTILNAAQGIVQYQPASGDVATTGSYTLIVVATFLTGPTKSDGIPFNIVAV